MFRPNVSMWFMVVLFLFCAYTAVAIESNVLNNSKLTDAEKITEPYKQGQEFVKVTVNLNQPWDILDRMNWRSAKSLSALQKEIHGRQQQVLETLSKNEFLLRHRYKNLTAFSAEVSLAGLQKLSNNPKVESIEPVFLLEPHLAQGISLMDALTTRSTYNGQGVAIAICDTGIDYTHPALGGGGFPNAKVIGGYDTGDNDADPIPQGQAHGTCCAGIAAGNDTSVGDYIGGVANDAKLYALKITSGTSGSAYNDDIAAAWDWCVSHQYDDPSNPIMVISTSFGGGRYYSSCDSNSTVLTNAANNAVAAGITLLVSSGNDGYCDSISSPACISSIISVGAVWDAAVGTYSFCVNNASCATAGGSSSCNFDEYSAIQTSGPDVVTSYSNTASFLDVLAPSHMAYTTDIAGSSGYSTGDYDTSFGGTSAACPYAAGAVAILQSASKAMTGDFLTPDEIRNLLTSTGDDITDEKVAITKPRVNVANAMGVFNESSPIAYGINKTVYIDTPTTITLNATDEGLPNPPGVLSYVITSLPLNGQLSDPGNGVINSVPYSLVGYGNQVVYTPNIFIAGSDSFQFKANDGGTAPDAGDSNIATVSINIAAPPQVIYSADMDADPGWTYEGDWEWGVPTGSGGAYGNSDPSSGYTGANVVGYNLAGDYRKIRNVEWVTTGAINCNDRTNVTLSFYRWLNVEVSDYDHAYIAASSDGVNWTTIWENASEVTDASWVLQSFDISTIADNQPTVYVRWGMGITDNLFHYSGWNIDDVQVAGNVPITQHMLTTSSTSGGSVAIPGEGTFQYVQDSVVNINAVPDLHYHFVDWSGTAVDASSVADLNAAVTTVTVDNDYTIQANFAIDTYTLEYTASLGGTLTGQVSQVVDYGSDGTTVTAVPDANYHFVKWSDDVMTVSRTDANITANISVIAIFAIDTFTLEYTAEVGGSITGETSQAVEYGSDGTTVTAVPNTGYHFIKWSDDVTTASRTDTNVTDDINVSANFGIDPIITISGFVTEPDPNYPVADVFITSEGEPNTVTDPNGFYEIIVGPGWSGTLTLSKTGYTFEPNSIAYTNVTADPNDSYIATLETFTISGYAIDADTLSPLADVLVSPDDDGGPFTSRYYGGADVTDANGFYEILVDTNFSGDVVPSKYAYAFDPNSLAYTNVTSDIVADQNYIGTLLSYTITGIIENPCELPIEGVFVNASDGGGSDITDPNGFYEVWVDYNWSGTVTPSKQHYTFAPNMLTYTDILNDQIGQSYITTIIYDINCDGLIELADLAILCQHWLETGQNIPGDIYKDEGDIVDLQDFAAFADVWLE